MGKRQETFISNYGARNGGAVAFKKFADCKQNATQSVDAYHHDFDNASFDVLSKIQCYKCRNFGHYANHCRP